MSANSQQLKQNFVNHPYVQQANKVVSGQVNALDSEVSTAFTLSERSWEFRRGGKMQEASGSLHASEWSLLGADQQKTDKSRVLIGHFANRRG